MKSKEDKRHYEKNKGSKLVLNILRVSVIV